MTFPVELQNRLINSLVKNSCGDIHIRPIDYHHDKIHQGEMLFVSDVLSVIDGADVYIHHVSGSTKYLHAMINVNSVGLWQFTSYSGTTYIAPGTELTQVNRKSDSAYVPEVKFYQNVVGDIDVLGTERLNFAFGSGTNPAQASTGITAESLESVFAPDLDVLVKLHNGSGATQTLTVLFNYYEEE